MIEILRWENNRFIQTDTIERHGLINVCNPQKSELEMLTNEMSIPLDFLTDPLDIDERSRIEVENGILLIVLRLPKFTENAEIPYTTFPAGLILTKNDTIVLVSSTNVMEMLNLSNIRLKGIENGKRSSVLLHIFLKTAQLYLRYLKEINQQSAEIETHLRKSLRNEELIKLLNVQKSLVFFMASLKANELMMERLLKTEQLKLTFEDKDKLEDVLIDNKQAIEMANIYSNILNGMMEAFASVISNNLNVVMKMLTSITIVLMIPTLAASIYGMNVELPFQHWPHAFYIVSGISLSSLVICVAIFRKNKWF